MKSQGKNLCVGRIYFSLDKVATSNVWAPGKRLIPTLWYRIREGLVKESYLVRRLFYLLLPLWVPVPRSSDRL